MASRYVLAFAESSLQRDGTHVGEVLKGGQPSATTGSVVDEFMDTIESRVSTSRACQ
jgi:hypothetical protein